METRKSQKIANELDCDIYRLLVRCERLIESDHLRKQHWANAVGHLRETRYAVRRCMSDSDRRET